MKLVKAVGTEMSLWQSFQKISYISTHWTRTGGAGTAWFGTSENPGKAGFSTALSTEKKELLHKVYINVKSSSSV